MAVLIPQFPTQTHIAMWRVAVAMRRLGVKTYLLSTRRPEGDASCHADLIEESKQTFYTWPPNWGRAIGWLLSHVGGVLAALGYLFTLKQEPWSRRLKLIVMLLSAANLASFCKRHNIRHLFIHSCADAAHLVAITRLLGGPPYALRLGGDLDVYGVDHAAKMKRATLIAAAAENNRQEVIQRIGLADDRVITLPLGVDTRRFTPADGVERAPGEAGRLRLVSVSRLHPRKGLDDVLHAIAAAKQAGVTIEYEMIGEGPSRGDLEALVAELGLGEYVSMSGAKGQDEVVAALQRAEAFVLASFGAGEGSPVAMIEAMACGLAIVSTRVGGTADMMTDSVEGLLVEQRDRGALADSLIRLANKPMTRKAMGQAACDRAVTRYDVLSVGRVLLGHFGFRLQDQGDLTNGTTPAGTQTQARASAGTPQAPV